MKKFIKILYIVSTALMINSTYGMDLSKSSSEQSKTKKSASNPLQIKLASEKKLFERLIECDLKDFAEQTLIHEKIGEKTIEPLHVLIQVQLSCARYQEILKERAIRSRTQATGHKKINQGSILYELLKEHPDALAYLQAMENKNHFYTTCISSPAQQKPLNHGEVLD